MCKIDCINRNFQNNPSESFVSKFTINVTDKRHVRICFCNFDTF